MCCLICSPSRLFAALCKYRLWSLCLGSRLGAGLAFSSLVCCNFLALNLLARILTLLKVFDFAFNLRFSGALGAIYGEKSMTFVAEHKVLFVRLLVGFLFLLAVAAALLYHFRPKWMFPPDDEECGVETDDADGNGSSHTRGLEPRVVNRGRNVYIEV